MKPHLHIEKDEKGYYVAEVPSMPGCISQGTTRKKVLENIAEAVEGWLEVMESKNKIHKKDLVTVKI
jgi:predicted RNase H-like HicB family nuclease